MTKPEGPLDSQKIRASTNERLRAAGAPACSTSLPVLLPQRERPVSPVLERLLVLGLVAMAANGLDPASVQQEVKRFELEDEMTALEAACINEHEGLDLKRAAPRGTEQLVMEADFYR